MRLIRVWLAMMLIAVTGSATLAWGQSPSGETQDEKKGETPKTFWEENTLFAYVENSYVWNLGKTSRGRVNDLRLSSRRIRRTAIPSATGWYLPRRRRSVRVP